MLSGCATLANQRKLEHEVAVLKKRVGPGGTQRQHMADLAMEFDEMRDAIARLEGRLDLAEHQAQRALAEARAARQQAVGSASVGPGVPPAGPGSDLPGTAATQATGPAVTGDPAEVQAYRDAHAAWRAGDTQACIDRFQQFLQTYASSAHADDAAFWMADCYFKQGDYRAAVLRFDDVASGYPTGDKAADALYRQGEALMRLGPGYAKAAQRAFERVVEEYPESPRVPEARRQLEVLGTG
jgi:tol-pal system protein YbgF